MGRKVPIENTAKVIDKVSRDSAEFGHVIENLRDSLLAGAHSVVFGIHGLAETPDRDHKYIAKRYIADDGCGMDEHVLRNVYSKFADTGTTRDFVVKLDAITGRTAVTATGIPAEDYYHSRSGMGGRATLTAWNGLGVVTITIVDGVARMVWMFRGVSGNIELREWLDDGSAKHIIEPYTEPKALTRDDLLVDKDFAKVLLLTSEMVSSADEVDDLIDTMTDEQVVINPLAGYSWDGDVIPKWIGVAGEDGRYYRADGTLAHGTVKFLLGDNPDAHTGLTGDPKFLIESEWSKYNGTGNRFFLDLTSWEVRIQTLVTVKSEDAKFWRLKNRGAYKFENGTPNTDKPRGRLQVGSLPLRQGIDPDLTDEKAPIEMAKVLDLDRGRGHVKYGQALVLLRKEDKGVVDNPEWWAVSKKGTIVVVYNNEVHGLNSDDVETKDFAFRQMGIPTSYEDTKGRVSVYLFPPRGSDEQEGVYQDIARSTLKWAGGKDQRLPLTGEDGINAAVRKALSEQAPDLVTRLYAASSSATTKVDMRRVRSLWSKATSLVAAGVELTKETATKPGLKAVPDGPSTGNPDRPAKNPPTYERDLCPECGLKIHADTCSRKPGPRRHGPPPGITLLPKDLGSMTGRKSRAKVADPEAEKKKQEEESKEPDPPTVDFHDFPPNAEAPRLPAAYTAPMGGYLPGTGTVNINRNHLTILRLYGIAEKAGRDEIESRSLAEQWIRQRVVEFVLGVLSVKGQRAVVDPSGKTIDQKWLIEELGSQILGSQEVWLSFLAGLLMEHDSLTGHIKAHAAVKRTTKARPAAEPEPAATEPSTAATAVADVLKQMGIGQAG